MQQKVLFQKCCRLCLDDSKQQNEIASVEKLAETLEKVYDLKFGKDDRCSKSICVDCQQEATEAAKWLQVQEELRQQIRTNQERFATEVLEQLGPEPVPDPPKRTSPSPRSARLSRRSTRLNATETPTEELAQLQADQIKEEQPTVVTRSRRSRSDAKQEWEPPASDGDHSETPTSTSGSSASADNEEDDASTAESGTSTSSDTELKCPRCHASFTELAALEKHACKFVCSICSAVLKHKKSLRKHLLTSHNIQEDQWESYWNPPQEGADEGQEQSLLVEGRKPRKRYRYESDSPTDIEDNNGAVSGEPASRRSRPDEDAAPDAPDDFLPDELVNIYCSLCNESFSGAHECPFVCEICGNTFAHPRNVKRHKVNVHKLDPDHPSLLINRRRSTSRPPSRPVSRAASEAPSEDDLPLSEVAAEFNLSRRDSVTSDWNGMGGGKMLYRFFCSDCDYTNVRRYRVTSHMKSTHGIPADQIDLEAIQKELLGMRSKTPEPSRTRHSSGSRTPARQDQVMTPFDEVLAAGGTAPPLDPAPLDDMREMVPESVSFPVMSASPGFRSRSRSTYQDDYDRKRKRSMSACSMREPRQNRAISERNVLVAKRRLTNAELLSRITSKYRPTMASIQANRLHVRPQLSCVPVGTPMEQPLRPRVSSFHPEEPCTNKRLYRRRGPVGNERTQVSRLRRLFQTLCDRVPASSAVNAIDVDSLVLVPADVLPPTVEAEPPEPDSTTPVAEDAVDGDVPVVIEIADENQDQHVHTEEVSEEVVETVETTETTVQTVEGPPTLEQRQEPEESAVVEETMEVEEQKDEEEIEETVQVVVEVQEEGGDDDEEAILPD